MGARLSAITAPQTRPGGTNRPELAAGTGIDGSACGGRIQAIMFGGGLTVGRCRINIDVI